MRWRPWLWLCVSVICFVSAAYFWRLGEKWAAERARGPAPSTTNQENPAPGPVRPVTQSQLGPMRLLSDPGHVNSPPWGASPRTNDARGALAYRLSNNHAKSAEQFARAESSILLENALIDTGVGVSLPIPDSLKAQGDPGSYIVQCRGPTDAGFRSAVKSAGAVIVAYIPNNAYLVRGSELIARRLQANPQTQVVLPYEPYYKLKTSLLKAVMEQTPLPKGAYLNVLLFEDARETVLSQLQQTDIPVVGQEQSPFGPVLKVRAGTTQLPELAGFSGVQAVELVHPRRLANDLSRAVLEIAADAVTSTNYLNLSGSNIVVNINDTGVDTNHPDLSGRVIFDFPISGVDSNGHGTHVAGIIAGDGSQSATVSNASGSFLPASSGQFRGMAPGAKLLSLELSASDRYLQETAARTNALISNNSWTYDVVQYDLAAAGYDAAVRDSLPAVTGPQPIAYVFPTGNGGTANRAGSGANEAGTGGVADSIRSPGSAKNVITVGAVEQLRNITNAVSICTPDPSATNGVRCYTNIPWFGGTDSSNQVASFSGRGNIGINLEGEFGRFKPDVVASGTFVVSTRSGQWDEQEYYNSVEYSYDLFTDILLDPGAAFVSAVFVPANGFRLVVDVVTPNVETNLTVSVTSPNSVTVTATNQVSISPLDPTEDFWNFTISNTTARPVIAAVQTILVITNNNGDFFQVLSNMNEGLGQYYRYESGSSLAAAQVSGTLALMHEFFQQKLHVTNSPALMKALLINGARSLGNVYNFQVDSPINYQGWGRVQLPNSIPAALTNLATSPTAPSPLYFFDQNATNALASGQSQTRFFSIDPVAASQDLRVTVVWTDPPGNPAASIKLVNDLDLVLTNLDTGEVYFGNDIGAGNDYNLAWDTNATAKVDIYNNVENIYIRNPNCTNFSVTVIGHRVNVNAVSGHPDNVAQDYALVVSSGDGLIPNALTVQTRFQDAFVTVPNVTTITNMFPPDDENPVSGGLLMQQHVGANTPLLGTNQVPLTTTAGGITASGMTNQWHFYVLSNDFNYTNASFVTFLPPNLALPRMGVHLSDLDNATRVQADIDMYVTTEAGLTNLDPGVLLRADKSLSRGGTEFIVYSNAAPGSVYYIGIKAEDQMAAEFEFLGIFSLLPPTTTDEEGNMYLRGMPVPRVIPPGTPRDPQSASVIAIGTMPVTVRRAIVTNIWNHTMPGSLLGNLSHNTKFAVLNNHTCATDPAGNCYTNIQQYIYEDNGEGDVQYARRSDGPGSLKDFIGEEGVGVWVFDMINNFPAGTGAVNRLYIKLEPQNLDTNGIIYDLLPNTFRFDSIEVPADATNLTICVSGNDMPVELYVMRGDLPSRTNFMYSLIVNPPGDCLSISIYDDPPLVAGRYYIGVFNPNMVSQRVRLTAEVFRNPYAIATSFSNFAGPVPIADDAVTYAYVTNLFNLTISALDVSLLIHHPRISDLAITLISPNGTRVLLFEDRGGTSTNGLGTFSAVTNGPGLSSFAVTNMTPFYTNDFDSVPVGFYAPGAVFDGWNVLTNLALVYPLMPAPWLSNNVLVIGDSVVSKTLPTTNSTAYALSYRVTHAPYLNGTITWWPLDEDGRDIFGGFDGLLSGNVLFRGNTGMVNQAFFGDGIATRMMVPRCPDLDVGQRRGFTVEGWIRPENITSNNAVVGRRTLLSDGFENAVPGVGIPAGSTISGWLVASGDVDVMTNGAGFIGVPYEGRQALDINGWTAGTISRTVQTVPGSNYILSFAYTKNPSPALTGYPDFIANAGMTISGQPVINLSYAGRNSYTSLNWAYTSIVFQATSAATTITIASQDSGEGGMYFDGFKLQEGVVSGSGSPIVEWYDTWSADELARQGVQFWLSGLPGTNSPGALVASLYDTNGVPHRIATGPGALTNSTWQHVAFSYESANRLAKLYTNGHLAVAQQLAGTNLVPRTSGDLYLGYHPSFAEAIFFDDFNGPDMGTNWQATLPTFHLAGYGSLSAVYLGAPNAAFQTLEGSSVLRMSSSMTQLQRRGWSSTEVFRASGLRYEVRFNTINQSATTSIDAFIEIGLIDAANNTRYDLISPYGGGYSSNRQLSSGSSIDNSYVIQPFQYLNNTWYRLVIEGAPGQNLRASLLSDSGVELFGRTFSHTADAYSAGFRVFLSQAMGLPTAAAPADVAVDFARLTAVPGPPIEAVAFDGGLDEFGLYSRPLWDNEILAIYDAGVRGKYGTNVTRCPVTNSVQLITSVGATTYTFTNGYSWWTNGPQWETNIIYFTNLFEAAYTNGPSTNFTAMVLANSDENAAFDEFVLWSLQTNHIDGQLHFTENTNLARLPIKFAAYPYVMSNFPPTLIFSNQFELATQAVYQAGSVLPGTTNSGAFGPRDWTVVNGPITVITNTLGIAMGSNAVALGRGGVQCTLPTSPGHRYELSYSVRGPGAVSWWSGDIEPLSQRAWDLLGGNQGALLHQATNAAGGMVSALGQRRAFYLPGLINPTNGEASKIEVGDPANLRLTNGFTIEGWVMPMTLTNFGVEQILFRGDSRSCADPYYLALRRVTPDELDIVFHIEDEGASDCGIVLATVRRPVIANQWQHIAAVFEPNVVLTNGPAWPTNQLRIYYNGRWLRPAAREVELMDSRSATIWNDLTARFPFRDLDPGFSPGVAIGNRSRLENSQPFNGFIDELSVYGRALTGPEIAAIAAAGAAGKADFRAPPNLSLAKVSVRLDNVQIDVTNGDNARWTRRSFEFTADRTNLVLTLQSLLPGTIVDGITLTELPAEMDYLPEESLSVLNGEDAYGVWALEIWDTRAGGFVSNDVPSLVQWELNFTLPPSNPPPIISLSHGIPYTNTLTAYGIQNLVVEVPQWATNATNVLIFASDRTLTNPLPVGVLWDPTNQAPSAVTNAIFWPPVTAGTTNLTTNTATSPFIVPGQAYYITVTNPNPTAVTFAYGVWFNILSLTNCQPLTNFVWQAGIPRYFQFDVPTNALAPGEYVSAAWLYLTGVGTNYVGLNSNLTVVVSQHLPLPDLTHFDYISFQPSTNDAIVMVLTNTTPFPIQNTRWYVGVFSEASTNTTFQIQSCWTTATNYPAIVSLTNSVPFTVVDFTNRFIAPPGPPRAFFFALEVTNYVDALLFELYNLSGDLDLVLERELPPTMAPYFGASFRVGHHPEQIVVRTSFEIPDLRGTWYLGLYNNESNSVAYTVRAAESSAGLLQSGQPTVLTVDQMLPPHELLLQWNAIVGEYYQVEFTPTLSPPLWTPLFNGLVQATTPLATFEAPIGTSGSGFYRIVPVSRYALPSAPLIIQLWTNGLVRISWSTAYPNQRLHSSEFPWGPWVLVNVPPIIEGNEYVVYDTIGPQPKYYSLFP